MVLDGGATVQKYNTGISRGGYKECRMEMGGWALKLTYNAKLFVGLTLVSENRKDLFSLSFLNFDPL